MALQSGNRLLVTRFLRRAKPPPVRGRRLTRLDAADGGAARKPDEATVMDFGNSTTLLAELLRAIFADGLADWSVGRIRVRVRYTRSTAFSGTCIYADRRIYVNLGRRLRYPYSMKTNLAKVRTVGRGWRRELYRLEMRDPYELALFIFMHELYHLLVYRSGRNTRQKESMCDRFAARYLVDRFGCAVRSERGGQVPREAWDFQDLEGFVAAVRNKRPAQPAAVRKAGRECQVRRSKVENRNERP